MISGIVAGVVCGVVVSAITVWLADWYADGRRRQRNDERSAAFHSLLNQMMDGLKQSGDTNSIDGMKLKGSGRLTLDDWLNLQALMRAAALVRAVDDAGGASGIAGFSAEQMRHLEQSIEMRLGWPSSLPGLWHYLRDKEDEG